MKKSIWLELCCALIILLFLYTGINKLYYREMFLYDLGKQPIPDLLKAPISYALPTIEILISFGIFINKLRLWALYVAAGLMTLFSIYAILILSGSFTHAPCSCGGVIRHLTWKQHLLFNLFYVAVSLLGIKQEKSNRIKYAENKSNFQKPKFLRKQG